MASGDEDFEALLGEYDWLFFHSIQPKQYLLDRKFPVYRKLLASSSLSTGVNIPTMREQIMRKAEAYKNELSQMSPEQIKVLFLKERKKEIAEQREKEEIEDRMRFFNQPSAKADFQHWSMAAYWTLDEAVALSFGKAPELVKWESLKLYTNVSAFAKEFERRRDLATRAKTAGSLSDPVLPGSFIAWAMRLGMGVSAELIEQVKARGTLIADWKTFYEQLSAQFEKQKELLSIAINNAAESEAENIRLSEKLEEIEAKTWDGFDPAADNYPEELDIALIVWRSVTNHREPSMTPKQQIEKWLADSYSDLSKEARQRISMVCNWNKMGGRP